MGCGAVHRKPLHVAVWRGPSNYRFVPACAAASSAAFNLSFMVRSRLRSVSLRKHLHGSGMTLNFDTLKASLVLYGLDAIYAAVLLIIGWYLSRVADRFVARVLTVTHRVDPLVTVFLASLARYATLVFVVIRPAAFRDPNGQQRGRVGRHVPGDRAGATGSALQSRRWRHAADLSPFRIGDDVRSRARRERSDRCRCS
jgi:hypothetical protein